MAQTHSVLERIAYLQGRRDEVPNQQLATELAEGKNRAGIQEIAAGLHHKDSHIQSDCLKVLYEIAYRDPRLVATYVEDFIGLLSSKNNRLVWGAMIALATVAKLKSSVIGTHLSEVLSAMKNGSVITNDNGVSVLAVVASQESRFKKQIIAFLIQHLKDCRAKDIPQHAERMLEAIDSSTGVTFAHALKARLGELNPSQLKRVQKVIAAATKD